MNRIKLSPLATTSHVAKGGDQEQNERLVAEASAIDPLMISELAAPVTESSTFVPLHYEPSYRYPLIVWLHDQGSDMDQLAQVMAEISLRNYVAVAPRSPQGDAYRGYFWDDDPTQVQLAQDSINAAIDRAMSEFSINSSRIFIGGFGAAGTMALRAGMERPEIFRGVFSINGCLPERHCPMRSWKSCRDLEVYWAHFRESISFCESKLCEQLRVLHVAGLQVTLRQYPGDERLSSAALRDVDRWVMEMIDSSIRD